MRYLLSMILVISFSSVSYSEDVIGGFFCDVTHLMTIRTPSLMNDISEPQFISEFSKNNTSWTPILAGNSKLALAWTKDDFGLYAYNNNQFKELKRNPFENLKKLDPLIKPKIVDWDYTKYLKVYDENGYLYLGERMIDYSYMRSNLFLIVRKADSNLAYGHIHLDYLDGDFIKLSLNCTRFGKELIHLLFTYK